MGHQATFPTELAFGWASKGRIWELKREVGFPGREDMERETWERSLGSVSCSSFLFAL